MSANPFPATVDSLAERAFRAEAREMSPDERKRFRARTFWLSLAPASAAGAGFAWALETPMNAVPLVTMACGVVIWPISCGLIRASVRPFWRTRKAVRLMRAYRAGDPDAFELVPAYAIRSFRRQIETHRARTIGRNSEWQKARDPLHQARSEARRQISYWWARMAREPDSPLVRENLDKADKLEAKLKAALNRLDSRADLLRRFFDDCEARIAGMSQDAEDQVRSLRLQRLRAKADARIAKAEQVLARIGADFVERARRFAGVVGRFERIQIAGLAGETPLDDIERLADRIIESHARDRAEIDRLVGVLGQ